KQQLFFDSNALHDSQTGKLLTTAQRRDFMASQLHFPDTLKSDSDLVKSFGALNTNFSRRLDPKLRIPQSYQVNFGMERDLGRGYSVETNFTLTRGIHLWREFNANAPRLPAGYSNFASFQPSTSNPNSISRVMEFGVPVSIFNLTSPTSSTAIATALAALNNLRPDPSRAEVEQLISAGNSFYRGLTLELRR